jgi:hypothetical protein
MGCPLTQLIQSATGVKHQSDGDPNPSIFVIDLQDASKKLTKKVFLLSTFKGTFTSFFKGKKSKKSNKTVGIKVFLTIFA